MKRYRKNAAEMTKYAKQVQIAIVTKRWLLFTNKQKEETVYMKQHSTNHDTYTEANRHKHTKKKENKPSRCYELAEN